MESRIFFVGWTGTFSTGECIEVAEELAEVLDLIDEQLAEVQVEYSCQRIASLEMEPDTAQDFHRIQTNGDYVEEMLLN